MRRPLRSRPTWRRHEVGYFAGDESPPGCLAQRTVQNRVEVLDAHSGQTRFQSVRVEPLEVLRTKPCEADEAQFWQGVKADVLLVTLERAELERRLHALQPSAEELRDRLPLRENGQ